MSSKVAIPDDSIEYLLTRNDRTVRKKFLSRIYSEWAQLLLDYCGRTGLSIEIGASNPIVKRLLDRENVLGLDVVYSPMIALQGDATNLPFTQNSVSNLLAIDTLHHLPDAQLFFLRSHVLWWKTEGWCLSNPGAIDGPDSFTDTYIPNRSYPRLIGRQSAMVP